MKPIESREELWKAVVSSPNDIQHLYAWLDEEQSTTPGCDRSDLLKRVAELPGSWLAKIWLTRALLAEGKLDKAFRLYHEVLRLAPRKSLAVQEISGHLGEAGYYREVIDLLLPIYSLENHGPYAGFNLFNACEDAHDWDAAQEVLNCMRNADWPQEPGSHQLKEIVRIRQEKLDILRDMREESTAALN